MSLLLSHPMVGVAVVRLTNNVPGRLCSSSVERSVSIMSSRECVCFFVFFLAQRRVGWVPRTNVFEVMFRVIMDDDVDVDLAPHVRSSENS